LEAGHERDVAETEAMIVVYGNDKVGVDRSTELVVAWAASELSPNDVDTNIEEVTVFMCELATISVRLVVWLMLDDDIDETMAGRGASEVAIVCELDTTVS